MGFVVPVQRDDDNERSQNKKSISLVLGADGEYSCSSKKNIVKRVMVFQYPYEKIKSYDKPEKIGDVCV